MTIPEGYTPIPERGGNLFRIGTVYYSKEQNAFLRAGSEAEGPLSMEETSGLLRWERYGKGRTRFRDQTGAFVSPNVFLTSSGINFGLGTVGVRETLIGRPTSTMRPGPDGQFVERITLLRADGRVEVVNINHGIGSGFNPDRQAKQWWRKMQEATQREGKRLSYDEVRSTIVSTQYIIQTNLGGA